MIESNIKNMTKFKNLLYNKFEILELFEEAITLYLKLKYIQVKERIFIIQKEYTYNILTTLRTKNCAFPSIPVDDKLKFKVNMKEEVNPILYWSIVGKCLYLIHTRHDIQFSIRIVNQFMVRPQ